mmetsp:Transcript_167999/g.322640  ORF Transcript_167999/g.322640 Transcript_167999/m.322640 type:complete len:99 (-) Transcript_167999:2510-2806(-)
MLPTCQPAALSLIEDSLAQNLPAQETASQRHVQHVQSLAVGDELVQLFGGGVLDERFDIVVFDKNPDPFLQKVHDLLDAQGLDGVDPHNDGGCNLRDG